MKSTTNLFLILTLLFISTFTSCDVIEEPYEKDGGGITVGDNYPNILLEEFTAHTCVHCPRGNKRAKALEELYKGKIFIVSIHCGSLARPQGNYVYDYRTPEGEELNSKYDGEAGMPCGLVNRQTAITISDSKWAESITNFWKKNKTCQVNIDLSAEYNTNTNKITAIVKLNYLLTQSKQNKVCVWILEDSIISPQKNYEAPYEIPDYCHDDVLRASMNGTWGELLSSSTIAMGTEFNKSYTYQVAENKDWKPNNLRLIAFVYDDNGIKHVVGTKPAIAY